MFVLISWLYLLFITPYTLLNIIGYLTTIPVLICNRAKDSNDCVITDNIIFTSMILSMIFTLIAGLYNKYYRKRLINAIRYQNETNIKELLQKMCHINYTCNESEMSPLEISQLIDNKNIQQMVLDKVRLSVSYRQNCKFYDTSLLNVIYRDTYINAS